MWPSLGKWDRSGFEYNQSSTSDQVLKEKTFALDSLFPVSWGLENANMGPCLGPGNERYIWKARESTCPPVFKDGSGWLDWAWNTLKQFKENQKIKKFKGICWKLGYVVISVNLAFYLTSLLKLFSHLKNGMIILLSSQGWSEGGIRSCV